MMIIRVMQTQYDCFESFPFRQNFVIFVSFKEIHWQIILVWNVGL
jgi:hypothetical protein